MSHWWIDATNYQEYEVGQKAKQLFELKKQGLKVPELICIGSEYFQKHLKVNKERIKSIIQEIDYENELSLKSASQQLCTLVSQSSIVEEMKEQLTKALFEAFGDNCSFSVRSSSNVEDGTDSSFAGQFSTYLEVPIEQVADKVLLCFCSLYTPNVIQYCFHKKIQVEALSMAVIIQQMVPAQYSGVAFSVNPKGLLNEMVIVVGEGTGNLVVEDKVPTTTYYYDTSEFDFYFERQEESPLLKDSTLFDLVTIVNEVKKVQGGYVDLEFALVDDEIYVLQARPITTLSFGKEIVLDNSNIVESYPNITLPLTASFVKEAYYGVFHNLLSIVLPRKNETANYESILKEMVQGVNGRMYYHINHWYTLIQCLPYSKKIIPIWQEMLGVSNKEYKTMKKRNFWENVSTYTSVIKHFFHVPKDMKQLNESFTEVITYFNKAINEKNDYKSLSVIYKNISDKVLLKWGVTLLNDLYAFVFVGLLKAYLKKIKIASYDEITNQFISGISNIESLKPIKGLIHLANLAIEGQHLDTLSSLQSSEMVKAYLTENDSEFTRAFSTYIESFGDRSLEELKLESQTFRAEPLTLLVKIMEYVQEKERLQLLAITLQNDEDTGWEAILQNSNPVQRRIIRLLSKRAQLGIENREISRLNRSRIYGMVRTIFLQMGELFYEEGRIEHPKDIFYLKLNEVLEDGLKHQIDYKKLITKRKEEYQVYEQLPSYSRLIFADGVFNKYHRNVNSIRVEGALGLIYGIPCSNGIVTGEVVVVEDPKTIKDFKDKILVTKMTDPGWIFLMSLAKGIIAEKGSLLSHTAIISRELEIPAIVGVKNITHILKTGDIVTINGNSGEVIVEKRIDGDVSTDPI